MADNTLTVEGRFSDGISPALKQIESGIIRVVGAFSAMSTALATLGAPILMAAEYQKQLLNVQKTTDYTANATAYLGKELINLSKNIDVSANALAKIAELGGQLGIGDSGAKALLSFTEEIARAVTALDVDAELAATSLGKLIQIFNIEPGQYRNVLSAINQISNVSTARPEELFDILRRIGNLGGSVTVDQATAMSATMIDLGLTAETAGTSLTKVFADMKASAGDFANFVGMSTEQWSQKVEKDGIGALKLYLTTLNKMPPAIAAATKAQLTGEGRIFGLITKLQEEMGKGGGLIDRRLNEAAKEYSIGTSAMKEQQNVLSGLTAQWQVFKNRVSALFTTAGEQTLAPLTRTLRTLGDALADQKNIDAFATAAKNLVEAFGLVAGAIKTTSTALSSFGLNWSRLMDMASLLLVVQGIRMAGAAISFVGSAMRTSLAGTMAEASTSAQKQTSIWASTTGWVAKLGQGYEATALAARVSAAQQVVAAASVAAAARKAQLEAAASNAQQQANAYFGRWVRPLETKIAAGTETAQEAAQYQARVARYRAMTAELNNILLGHVATTADAQRAITNVTNVEIQRRLAAFLTAMRQEQAALRVLAAEQNATSLSQIAGASSPATTRLPGLLGKIRSAAQGLATVGLGGMFATWAGNADAFAHATTRVGRAAVVTASAMRLLGKAVSFVLSRFLGWVTVAIIVVEVGSALLEMLGILNEVKDATWAVLKFFGMKTRPEFLDSQNSIAEAERIQRTYAELIAERQKFEQRFGTIAININPQLSDTEVFSTNIQKVMDEVDSARMSLAKGFTFSIADPGAAAKAVTESLVVIDQLVAGANGASAEYEKVRMELQKLGFDITSTTQAYERLVATQGADSEEAKTTARALDSLKERYAGLSTAVTQAAEVMYRTNTAIQAQISSTFTFLNADAGRDLFLVPTKNGESLIETLQNIKAGQKAIADEAKKAGVTDIGTQVENTSGFTPAQLDILNKQREAYIAYGKAVEATKKQLMELDSLKRQMPNDAARSKFIDTLTQQANVLAPAAREAAASTKGLAGVMKGLGDIKLPTNTNIDQVAATIAIAAEGKRAYSELAAIAQAKANDAKNALARALDKNKQDYKEFADFMTRVKRSLDSQVDRAATQSKTRAIEDGTATRQTGLNAAKQLENDILNTIKEEGYISQADIANRLAGLERARMFGEQELARMLLSGKITKETYDREMKGLNDGVMMQKEVLDYYYTRTNVTKEEAAAIQNILDLKYRAADRKIVDEAEAQKTQLVLDNTAKAFNRLDNAAMKNVGTIQSLEQQLSRDDLSYDKKIALIEKRNQAQAELASGLGQLRTEAEKFANIDPVAGKVIIDETKVKDMQDLIKRYTEAQANLNTATVGSDKAVYQGYANQLSAVAQGFDMTIVKARELADTLKVTEDQLVRYITAAKGLPEVAAKMAEFTDALSKAGSGVVAEVDVSSILDSINKAVRDIDPKQLSELPPVQFKALLDQNSLAETRANLSLALTGSAKDAEDAINAKGGMKVKGELDITKVNMPAQSATMAANNRDGGHIQAFAGGGTVRGAGDGRSDSILSWLSHGEYVMDATTVRMLGSGFFRTLQALAQRGTNLSALRSSLPAFASGGAVAMSGIAGKATAGFLQSIAQGDGGDTVNLDLSLNGSKRSRVRGARSQINGLVEAIREVQKGMAK